MEVQPSAMQDCSAREEWRPVASIETLRQRAAITRKIREWFYQRNILEVETPQLVSGGTTDPHIDSFQLAGKSQRLLRTSAEFHQKRLLAAGSGDIYELGKVFRVDESGQYHNPEFTMLEWYRCGIDHHTLVAEVEELLTSLHADTYPGLVRISYRDLWQKYAALDIADRNCAKLVRFIEKAGCDVPVAIRNDYDALLDLGMAAVIASQLPKDIYTCIYNYPASQASLAKIDSSEDEYHFACRFEIYFGSVELANGYHELTDGAEQAARFEADNQQRTNIGKAVLPVDYYLIAAMNSGLPPCAGVAVGIDRLMMVLLEDVSAINQVLSFDWGRA